MINYLKKLLNTMIEFFELLHRILYRIFFIERQELVRDVIYGNKYDEYCYECNQLFHVYTYSDEPDVKHYILGETQTYGDIIVHCGHLKTLV